MAVSDLLWACPLCGLTRGIRRRSGTEACSGCGATFHRTAGAAIAARLPDGTEVEKPAARWVDDLPEPPTADARATIGPERAVMRVAKGPVAVRPGGRFVGWAERFGKRRHGTVSLTADALVFEGDDGERRVWAIDDLTAVQPTSSALQVKARGQPVAVLQFLESSVRLWEHHLHHRLRFLYRRTGRGEIVEFQPRICTR